MQNNTNNYSYINGLMIKFVSHKNIYTKFFLIVRSLLVNLLAQVHSMTFSLLLSDQQINCLMQVNFVVLLS